MLMHGAQESVGVAAITAPFFNSSFFLTAWPLRFSRGWNYISHTSLFLSAGFSFSQMFPKKKNRSLAERFDPQVEPMFMLRTQKEF